MKISKERVILYAVLVVFSLAVSLRSSFLLAKRVPKDDGEWKTMSSEETVVQVSQTSPDSNDSNDSKTPSDSGEEWQTMSSEKKVLKVPKKSTLRVDSDSPPPPPPPLPLPESLRVTPRPQRFPPPSLPATPALPSILSETGPAEIGPPETGPKEN